MKKYLWDKMLYFLNFLSPPARRQLIAISYLTKHYGHFNSIKAKVSGWVDVEFVGFGPINRYIWSTTVIINPNEKIPRLHKHISPISNSFR